MSYNIGKKSADERLQIAQDRAEALESYKRRKLFDAEVDREYNRILSERSNQRGRWREYALRQLADIRDDSVREAVLARLNAFQKGIAAGRIG